MKKIFIAVLAVALLLAGCTKSPDTADTASSAQSQQTIAESKTENSSATDSTEDVSETETASDSEATPESTAAPESKADTESTSAPESKADTESVAAPERETESDSEDTENADEDIFAGTYTESIAGRGVVTVTNSGDNIYSVHVRWSSSAYEYAEWDFSGEWNGRAVLFYENCTKTVYTYDEDGNETSEVEYTGGTGYIQLANKDADTIAMFWHDDVEDVAADSEFIKQ